MTWTYTLINDMHDIEMVGRLTEPMERKNPKVAALLSMYCDRVGRTPRGPAPPLRVQG